MIFKIKKYILLDICLVYSFFRGGADKTTENPGKVLVVQMAKLGDMVCATPVFSAIKKKYPQCKVYVLGNRINKELLEGSKDVDGYIVFEGFGDALKKIRKEKFDFGCVLVPDFIGLAVLYLSGIPLISAPAVENGYSPYETWQYKILRNFVVAKPHKMGSYAPREYLRLLEPIGVFTDVTQKHLVFSGEAEAKVDKFFSENCVQADSDLIVGISPSAGNKIKYWGAEKFAKLADHIYEKYNAKIIIIGGGRDKEEVEKMINSLDKKTKTINASGVFNIDELKALVSKLSVFIGVDTGPIYIAEAFGVPTIDIVGPMDEREQPPIGETHRAVYLKDRKSPELHIMNARVYNEKEARRQVDEISVEMVANEFDNLVALFKLS